MSRAPLALAAALVLAAAGCTGGRAARALRVTLTESAGDLTFTLEEPIRAVTCVERDHRRDASAPAAARVVWDARCNAGADCFPSVRYGDHALTTTTPPGPLAPSAPGMCYECVVMSANGRGFVRFRTASGGGFEACTARAGTL